MANAIPGTKYVTRRDRFEAGNYPMVCVRTGQPADMLAKVQARRVSVWPFMLLPISVIQFLAAKLIGDRHHIVGLLPVAAAGVASMPEISITYERAIGVIINGAHPAFIEATRSAQGKTGDET